MGRRVREEDERGEREKEKMRQQASVRDSHFSVYAKPSRERGGKHFAIKIWWTINKFRHPKNLLIILELPQKNCWISYILRNGRFTFQKRGSSRASPPTARWSRMWAGIRRFLIFDLLPIVYSRFFLQKFRIFVFVARRTKESNRVTESQKCIHQ